MVVDKAVHHCESLVAERAGGGGSSNDNYKAAQLTGNMIRSRDDGQRKAEEGHARLKVKAALFYADDGLVASTNPGWLQSTFDTLTGIFNCIGL